MNLQQISKWTFICVGLIYFFLIWRFSIPPSVKDKKQLTKADMSCLAYAMQSAMKHTGHTNIMEYLNCLTIITNTPYSLSHKIIPRIIEDARGASIHFWDGCLLRDAWGHPITITIQTNFNGCLNVTFHSFGKNKRNENGKNDDIIMCFDATMYSPDSMVALVHYEKKLLSVLELNGHQEKIGKEGQKND